MLEISLRTLERWEKPNGLCDQRKNAERHPSNKLTLAERNQVLEIANSKEYCDLPPSKIVPLLADKGEYIASESTFYRILKAENQLSHRTPSRPAKHSRPKTHVAFGPNQVWSWDISYLPSQVRGIYYFLYLIMDVYSRKIVGWSIHETESSELGAEVLKQAYLDERVEPGQLVLHSDNGAPMKGYSMLAMLQKLSVIKSFSRPSVSDDNPYSESLFKTLKYHPDFPRFKKFESISDARKWSEKFATWYNCSHMHSSLKFVTPEQRHTGVATQILQRRHQVYVAARAKNPERWSLNTRNWNLPSVVTLNPNKKSAANNNKVATEYRLAA